ncbi:RNA polymerase sigma factor [Metabacillus litoralis]|uniref:RNA polymerase sigma factor n=1 Tax=Metabacillus litoralis TaxID=152268 RepID=UPI0013CF2CDE|nr:RNA polymerase sigma factor [Metabacillus litoralis]
MNERALIKRIKSGDEIAFNELFKPYILQSRRTAYLFLYDYGMAQDAVQEALFEAYKSIGRYDPSKASFKTWFNKIVVNCSIKMLRKKKYIAYFSKKNGVTNNETPEIRNIIDEETKEIYQCINQLSVKLRIVIILYYFQDLSITEISKMLDISEGTVKSRLYKARQKLRNLLSYEEYMGIGGGSYGTKN